MRFLAFSLVVVALVAMVIVALEVRSVVASPSPATTGSIKCWGWNINGQLGDGTTSNCFTPVDVSGLASGAATMSAGHRHTCAVTTAGAAACWGLNGHGQLGDGTLGDRTAPVNVLGLASGVAAISAGWLHTCALTTGGAVRCWGDNDAGQLGDGTTTQRLTPVDVSGLSSGVAAITAGGRHTCALTTAGGVKCWGRNRYGQLGVGASDANPHPSPLDVSGLTSGVAAISAGPFHTCALMMSGGAKCWGYNGHGELGEGTNGGPELCSGSACSTTAVDVSGLTSGVAAISAGGSHTCAMTTGGGLKCWGYNSYGELGDGSTTTRLTPVNVSGLTSGAVGVSAGDYHTCALTAGGGLKCWGHNYYGQLGVGTSDADAHPLPLDVSGLTGSAAAAGGGHSCALTATQPVVGGIVEIHVNGSDWAVDRVSDSSAGSAPLNYIALAALSAAALAALTAGAWYARRWWFRSS